MSPVLSLAYFGEKNQQPHLLLMRCLKLSASLKMMWGHVVWSKRLKQKSIWSLVHTNGVTAAAGMSKKDKRNQLAWFALGTHGLTDRNLY